MSSLTDAEKDAARKAFEEWMQDAGRADETIERLRVGNDYTDAAICDAWVIWQASRETAQASAQPAAYQVVAPAFADRDPYYVPTAGDDPMSEDSAGPVARELYDDAIALAREDSERARAMESTVADMDRRHAAALEALAQCRGALQRTGGDDHEAQEALTAATAALEGRTVGVEPSEAQIVAEWRKVCGRGHAVYPPGTLIRTALAVWRKYGGTR